MRTTITFESDVATAIEQLRRDRGLGVSAAVNELVRRGLTQPPKTRRFVQRTSSGHARVDVTNVTEVIELLDGPATP
jgi:hypothetical protein